MRFTPAYNTDHEQEYFPGCPEDGGVCAPRDFRWAPGFLQARNMQTQTNRGANRSGATKKNSSREEYRDIGDSRTSTNGKVLLDREELHLAVSEKNTERILRLAKLRSVLPVFALREALDIAEPIISKARQAEDMLASFEHVWNWSGEGWSEAIGFDKAGRLVWCDGNQLRQITLKESLQIFLRANARYIEDDNAETQLNIGVGDEQRWFMMIEAAIPG